MPPLVKWVSDKIQASTSEPVNPKALLLSPFMLATPMAKAGPGVKASPTPQRERKEAQRHSLDTGNSERLLVLTEVQNRQATTRVRRSTMRPINDNREHKSSGQSQGTQGNPVTEHGQGTSTPSTNPMHQESTMHAKTGPLLKSRKIHPSRNQTSK